MKKLTLLFICLMTVSWLSAQTIDSTGINDQTATKLSIQGNVNGSVYAGSEKFDFASAFAELTLQATLSKENTFLYADTRLRKGIFFGEDYQELQIKELYAAFKNEKLTCALGYQIVRKGRTDGFNPTDNLCPKNYFFLTSDPDDQLLPNFMLKILHHPVPEISVEAEIIPFYLPSVYRYDLFDMGSNVSFAQGIYPDFQFKNMSFSAAVDFEYPAIGGSVSFFRGYDPFHGFDVKNVDWSSGNPVITNMAVPYLKTAWGTDFSIPVGNLIIKGEGAYNITGNDDNKMYIPETDFGYVVGIETNIADFTFITQYIGKYIPDFVELTKPVLSDPLSLPAQFQYASAMIAYENRLFNRRIFHQEEKSNHALSLTCTRSFGYDIWKAECTVYYNFTSDEWLIRPEISVSINDATSLSVGGNYMNGDEKTLFSYSSKVMNGIFAALKVSF
jgi:hypothetical protein